MASVNKGVDDLITDPEQAFDDISESSIKNETSKRIPKSTLAENTTKFVAFGAVSTSLSAVILEGTAGAVVAASILSSLIAPYTAYQQKELTDIQGLKDIHQTLHNEVNRLEKENGRLNSAVDNLGKSIESLSFVETALTTITDTAGKSISHFAEQVTENKNINNEMTKNLRQNVMQNLVTVMMRCDTNGDNYMDDEETEELIERINSLNIVKLNEDRFRNAVRKSGGSLTAVIDIMKKTVTSSDDFFTILG